MQYTEKEEQLNLIIRDLQQKGVDSDLIQKQLEQKLENITFENEMQTQKMEEERKQSREIQQQLIEENTKLATTIEEGERIWTSSKVTSITQSIL